MEARRLVDRAVETLMAAVGSGVSKVSLLSVFELFVGVQEALTGEQRPPACRFLRHMSCACIFLLDEGSLSVHAASSMHIYD